MTVPALHLPPLRHGPEVLREEEPIGVPVRRLFAVLRRRGWLVVLVVLLGVGGMLAWLNRATPEYRAEAAVLIEPRNTQVSDLQAISPDAGNANLIRTQIDILRSPAMARRVVDRLNLAGTPGFSGGPGLLTRLTIMLHDAFGFFPEAAHWPSSGDPRETAAAILSSRIGVQNEPRSHVLIIWIETPSAELSAQIVNALANELLEFRRRQKGAAMERAHAWFSARLDELAERMRASERSIEDYRIEHGLTELIGTRNGSAPIVTINRQQLDDIARQLVAAETERLRKEGQLAEAETALRNGGRVDALPEVMNSPIIRTLRDQESQAGAREAQLAATLGARAPDLQAARSQRAGFQRRLREEMANALNGLRSEVAAARAQEASLRDRLAALRRVVAQDNVAEVRLQSLQAEAQANRAIYESFLTRATQLANASGIQEADAELVSEAVPAEGPSSPKRGRLLLVAFGASLVSGIALVFGLERLREGFSTPDSLESALGLASIGVLPQTSNRARQGGTSVAAAQYSASIARLRGVLQVMGTERRTRTIVVTSALPREGKSALALGLARSAARGGSRVLLICADLRSPPDVPEFGPPGAPGLAEILAGNLVGDGRDVLREAEKGLHVLPSGSIAGDAQELLGSPRLGKLLDWASKNFDLVLIDTPPVLPAADALLVARQADATVFAVRWERTPRAAARDALRLLNATGARVVGAVMTQVKLRHFARQASDGLAYLYRDHRGYYGHPGDGRG
ncbi:GumC family protein [Neoroseomonas oryzicola]|uniref:Polysaccharide biosynthesis tyrosine autokinase n=1 Tax=Neoroseomonas oryzicola TaxID=535904 RepID=A0A9X9WHU2_9PROT|nr:polysaccharide biosynthesis tyrosine autokinase [Neoroseomonas oryzicola]MBR0659902.1 polysaccharide biosynthesis tyrosine autokinase [Neoroseomonas oryzicola]NKE15658.1 polysaccharide biosynthesis tyrosine autokinase [Neoroseomonas oryzicola]